MFKYTLILSLLIIGTLVLAKELPEDCEACGAACKLLCGTKKFRICCIEYMRKKREIAPDMTMLHSDDGDTMSFI